MRYLVRICVIILCVMLLCGCWNRRELNTLAIVVGIGLDKGDNPGEIKLTAQLENTAESKSGSDEGGGGGEAQKPFVNITNTGTEVFSTMRDYNSLLTRKLYLPHNQIIVVSEDIAKSDLSPYLDFFLRDHESRLTVRLAVVKGKAEDALSSKPVLEKIPAIDIAGKIKNQTLNTSEVPDINLFEFFITRITPGYMPVIPLVTLEEHDDGINAVVSGCAVLSDGRMVGELNGVQTRGYLWMLGKVKSTVVNLEASDGTVGIEVIQSKSKIKPIIKEDGTPMVKVEITVKANLNSQQGFSNQATSLTFSNLQDELCKEIKKEVMHTLQVTQELRADIYGFGDKFKHYHPDEWELRKDCWSSCFSKLEVDVSVKAKINGAGKLERPAYSVNRYTS